MFKWLTKFDYLLRETLLGLQRGGWMNWAAISTTTVLLFLFGTSLQTSWQLEGLLNQFGSQLEVSVYLESGVQADTLVPMIDTFPEATAIEPVPKELAWNQLVAEMGISDIEGVTEHLNGNPLVDQLKVKARSSEEVPSLADKLRQIQGVDEVLYVSEAVERISQLNEGLSLVSLLVTTVLSCTAIAVITTTIRLIVMARRREIEVMQLVGATNSWIYLPFILQGIAFGVVGAALSWGLILGIQRIINQILTDQPDFVRFLANGLRTQPEHMILLPIALLGLGSFVGLIGSLFAVRRFSLR